MSFKILLTKFKMSAHNSFVIGTAASGILLWLSVLRLESSLGISHLVEASSTTTNDIVATSLIEVSASSAVLVVASSILLTSSETTSSSTSTVSSSATTAASSSLIAVVPLHTFQSELHELLRNRIIGLSQFGVAVSKMAPLAEDAVVVSLKMPTSFGFVLLVDLILAVLTNLLWVEVLLLLELVSVLGLTHSHLIHLLLLLHHLHLVWHHTRLHLHLHSIVLSRHLHIVHLIRCVHLQLI